MANREDPHGRDGRILPGRDSGCGGEESLKERRNRNEGGLERQPFYLTVEDVARDYLRTSPKAVYEMIYRRQLPGVVRFMKRRILVRRTDLVRWLEGNKMQNAKSGES